MLRVDLNADMGEGYEQDKELMDWVSSVNIACGYHAGDTGIMQQTIKWALLKKKAIGAHPSYPDREHFGRRKLMMSPGEVFEIVQSQLQDIDSVAKQLGAARLHHVKPHGALYNSAAKDGELAAAVARAVYAHDPQLILYGLSGSQLVIQGERMGLQTASEVFADRTYQDDGSLTPRDQASAMITDTSESTAQVIQMVKQGIVCSHSGKKNNDSRRYGLYSRRRTWVLFTWRKKSGSN